MRIRRAPDLTGDGVPVARDPRGDDGGVGTADVLLARDARWHLVSNLQTAPATCAVAVCVDTCRARGRSAEGHDMHPDTTSYNRALSPPDQAIGQRLAEELDRHLPDADNKIWHAHPVWFLDGNPIVGYSKLKDCVRLLFWSGQSFTAPGLKKEGSFKAAEARYTAVEQVDSSLLERWLAEARDVQWDYKNLVRRKGKLERLK